MRIDVAFRAADLRQRHLSQWRVVVVDAVRASSTIVTALASGARCIIPVTTIEEARALKQALANRPSPHRRGKEGEVALLGGERQGLPLPGFDLGNSPREYTPERVAGKTIVFSTTNGSGAIASCRAARECVVGAFLNMPAVVSYLAVQDAGVLFAAVGRQGAPVLDDTVCAGMYAERLAELAPHAGLTPAAREAIAAARPCKGRVEAALRESPSGQALARIGLGDDLAFCAQVGRFDIVPRLYGGEVRAG